MRTPRLIIIRHGETEWSKKGFYTSTTDLPLIPEGAHTVSNDGRIGVGEGRLVDPRYVRRVFVSPRRRAQETMDLFLHDKKWDIPAARFTVDDRCREWDYGEYEGLTTAQINHLRQEKGIQVPFKISRDGCMGGESPEEITERLDSLIEDIRECHAEAMRTEDPCNDVLVFAHGHSLRMLVLRWLRIPLSSYIPMLMPAGGLGVLSYEHNNLDEPAFEVGFHLSSFDHASS